MDTIVTLTIPPPAQPPNFPPDFPLALPACWPLWATRQVSSCDELGNAGNHKNCPCKAPLGSWREGLSFSPRLGEDTLRVGLAWDKSVRPKERGRGRCWEETLSGFLLTAVQEWGVTASHWLRARWPGGFRPAGLASGGPRSAVVSGGTRRHRDAALSVIAQSAMRRATGISSALLGPLELSRLHQPTSCPSRWEIQLFQRKCDWNQWQPELDQSHN